MCAVIFKMIHPKSRFLLTVWTSFSPVQFQKHKYYTRHKQQQQKNAKWKPYVKRDFQLSVTFISRLCHPGSGRCMDMRSTEPGVQVYTGKNMLADLVGKGGVKYAKLASICLEAQHYPNSPNQVSAAVVITRFVFVFRSILSHNRDLYYMLVSANI